jgi:two-component system sensor histidine kinase HydH
MMETFAAAAVSLSISIALIFKRKKSHLHLSFAVLCFALFFEKIGLFSYGILHTDLWKVIHYLGVLSIPPILVIFSRYLLNKRAFLLKWDILLTCLVSLLIALALFTTPLFKWSYVDRLLYLYSGLVLSYCFIALVRHIMSTSSHPEKKRMVYVAIACIFVITFSLFDVLHKYGYGIPPLSDIAIAGLLYFIFIIITHTDLPELYEIMLRTLLVFCIIVFATVVFIVVMLLFGEMPKLPFTSVFMASFLIVILIDPIRMLLRKTFSYFFFDKKELSASLYSIDDEVERKNFTLLEEMATGLAHEIRNPLGSIKGAAQFLKTEADRSGNPKLLDIIIEETDRLNTVVSQFLNYAKPYVINAEKQNINHIIKKVISLIKTTNLPDNITINENLATDLPNQKIDGEQMIQVLLNIALNGIEAMPDGGMLTFTTSRIKNDRGRTVQIIIRDTGRGITKEDLKSIFTPFFTTKKKGTGLGLPICQRIIKNHNGHIHVESTVNKGSAFYIRI